MCLAHIMMQRGRAYQHSGYDHFLGVIVETAPGDVAAFDLHTFHASFGGRDWLAWTVAEDEEASRKVLRWMANGFERPSAALTESARRCGVTGSSTRLPVPEKERQRCVCSSLSTLT